MVTRLSLMLFTWQELEQANRAMEELKGSLLPSSDRGGMHIEYILPYFLFVTIYL